jgi:hypothetical protein
LGSKLLEKARQSQYFRPDILMQIVKLRLELIADFNNPGSLYHYGIHII